MGPLDVSGARAAFERKCNSYLGVLYDGTNKLRENNTRVICNGPNGMSGARALFEWKLNEPMVPQAGARDRMVPFNGTICELFE